jgi:flavin-dependent dehydrogenase
MLLDTDVLVVGGGPAGLAAAIAARAKGFRVAVMERDHPPIDKACGEGLLPAGIAALEQLGIHLDSRHGWPFAGIRFLEAGLSVEARLTERCGLGIRRVILHQLLADRAAESGVGLLWGAEVDGLAPDGLWSGGRLARARWIVGADGSNSRCRTWAGLQGSCRTRRFGFRRHFRVAPWTDCVEVHWSERCQAYVTPVGAEELCVALVSRDPRIRFESLPALFPSLKQRLGSATSAAMRGGTTDTTALRRVTRGRIALVGEASGSVDALSGMGLSLAFRQAIAFADALAADDLSLYQQTHRRICRLPNLIGRGLLLIERNSPLRHSVLRAFAWNPALFSALLALHAGKPSTEFCVSGQRIGEISSPF